MKTMKGILVTLVVGLVIGVFPWVGASEIVPSEPPKIEFRDDIRLEFGITTDPVYGGNFYVKYLERPNNPGQFPKEKGTFLNSWFIFTVKEKDSRIVPINLVFQLWVYDTETMTKKCYHWEVSSMETVKFITFIEDKDNLLLDRSEVTELGPDGSKKFKPLIGKFIDEFSERLKKGKADLNKATLKLQVEEGIDL